MTFSDGRTGNAPPPAILWFRRDLRISDNPALVHAAAGGARAVVPLFVLDDTLRTPSGTARLAFLYRSLRSLAASLDGALVVRQGEPAAVVAALAAEVGAVEVVVSADAGRYGRARDVRVAAALRPLGIRFTAIGSPYAVPPGSLSSPTGSGYDVFSAYQRAWSRQALAAPMAAPRVRWAHAPGQAIPADPEGPPPLPLPSAGETAALHQLEAFLDRAHRYAEARDLPAVDATSHLSAHLKYGSIHPRQILARIDDISDPAAADKYRSELCWREFYADVLWRHPEAVDTSLRQDMDRLFDPPGPAADEAFSRWKQGTTGYPFVDAAMRQLDAEAWIPNRARLVAASFLTKHLHIPWQRGAAHFLDRLVDGDTASNNLSWQWTAGTGTDAAPYLRIFNPILQARRFDPQGEYVRRWVPELAGLTDAEVIVPWAAVGGPSNGYPAPLVDHETARDETQRRFAGTGPRRSRPAF